MARVGPVVGLVSENWWPIGLAFGLPLLAGFPAHPSLRASDRSLDRSLRDLQGES